MVNLTIEQKVFICDCYDQGYCERTCRSVTRRLERCMEDGGSQITKSR